MSFSCFAEVRFIRQAAVPLTAAFEIMLYLNQNKDPKKDFQSMEPL